MKVDLLLDPFGANWPAVRDAAMVAEEAGFSGLWTWDHLAGEVHGADRVLECWTLLSALAGITERLTLGPLVLNVANRRPGVLAVMAATLQEVSGGRLVLGLGAGGDRQTPYWKEQAALGLDVPDDRVRRRQVAEAVGVLRAVWRGTTTETDGEFYRLGRGRGFLAPNPDPPIVLGGFGPAMAELAGRVADGFNTQAMHPGLDELGARARAACVAAGGDPAHFELSAFAGLDRRFLGHGPGADRLRDAGVTRLILLAGYPYDLGSIRAIGSLATG